MVMTIVTAITAATSGTRATSSYFPRIKGGEAGR
jgi:hypothetical protein